MRRADLRSRRGLVRLNRADLNSSIFKALRRAGLRLGHDEGRGLVSLDPADHDNLSLGSFSRRKKHKTDIFGTDMNLIIQTIQIFLKYLSRSKLP